LTRAVPASAPVAVAAPDFNPNPWVTSSSRFLDPVWIFERLNPGRPASFFRINWCQPVGDGAMLTDARFAVLLRVARELIYMLMTTPPAGRRRHRLSSAVSVARYLFAFFRWLKANGYTNLAEVDPEAIARFRQWLLARRTRNGRPLAPNTLAGYFIILLDLHRFRDRLSDGLREHPFHGMELQELLGSLAATGEIPHIPADVAVPFVLLAVRWVRGHGPEIAAALEQAEDAYGRAAAEMKGVSACEIAAGRALRTFRFEHPPVIDGRPWPEFLPGLLQLRRLIGLAVTASFIVVAALTGMRVSELLGLEDDCLEPIPLDDGSDESLLYVRGILVKTAGTPHGERVRWVAGIDGPDNHVRAAVELLRRLTAGLRPRSGAKRLFLGIALREGKRPIDTPAGHTMNWRINTFATAVGVARPWKFSCHQFRKTFARFVALGDKTGLLALKQHFKHVSIAMTDRYIGRDLELLDLVDTERQQGIQQALDELLGADCLAGTLGEQIVARNHRFRGRAGQQVRGDYIRMVLEETDLVILPHEYGYCVYRAEIARCGGVWARVGLSTCINCANFAVAPAHVAFWERRRNDGGRLLAELQTLPGRGTAVAALRDMIVEADAVLTRIQPAVGSG
jgi:integrase